MRGFLKFIIIVALTLGLAYEIGSPLVGRSEAAGAAQDAANVAARDYFQSSGDLVAAKAAATTAAQIRGATVTNFVLEPDGSIKVTVSRPARSYVLHRISALKNWYNVTASATAPPLRA